MKPHVYTKLSDVTNLLSKSLCSAKRLKVSPNERMTEKLVEADMDEGLDFDDFEEVFADHIQMDKRLRKTLYAGNLFGIEDLPDHPPIALTGLAAELFSKAAPNYGLDVLDMDYVSAASKAARISPCAMIIAMIYLERLKLANSEYLEVVSPPGLFVVSMLVASKFLFEDEEDIATNQLWAEALNFDIKDLNTLEREFLSAIDWKIFVDSSEYLSRLDNVEKMIAIRQSSLRSWLSYSDMYVLCQDPDFQIFWRTVLKTILKDALLWTIGYATTALVLYSTIMALQKLKIEKLDVQSNSTQNNTLNLQKFAVNSLGNLYVKDEVFFHKKNIADTFDSPSDLDQSDENPASYTLYVRNLYAMMPSMKRKVAPFYTVEISKVYLPQLFQIVSSYFTLEEKPLSNYSYFNSDGSNYKKNLCPSVFNG
ncbi:hypothetical protein JTE90_010404 [Oedothorax gibbosus]|uniref:Protein CNPPD1 n=1 Tax=Oedothorax gibbosus TaxID=931172 RepID=A0AAV6VZI2_9ARAC|nr:hypothetical protein JTE90_010404 [Oedothorax gibbosus]